MLFDPFTNNYSGISYELAPQGPTIEVRKPFHLRFLPTNTYHDALTVEGESTFTGSIDIVDDANVGGDVTATAFNTLSDANYKINVEPFYFADLSRVKVYTYNVIGNCKKKYGVLAQELFQINDFKDFVVDNGGPDHKLSVDYIQFVPILIHNVTSLSNNMHVLNIVSFYMVCMSLYLFVKI